ncbi:MAG: UbiX family flavin prenyltransferase [Prevotellaceae bacterium]|jgi:4-hydroxy-3-polyprenylbenzoate decarboxylase|nr:UbiX family flavin prenyltransferase [Prevotellaceae bacterium]
MKKRKIVIGITGASGHIYAKHLLDTLAIHSNEFDEIAVIFTETGKKVFDYETGENIIEKYTHLTIYDNNNFFVSFASGSSDFDTLIVIPCSMGTLARIANGYANDLISRTADVMLKERRKLIVVTRETPLNLIHIQNMEKITLAGAIVCPASPSFYSKPQTITDIVKTVTERVLQLAQIDDENSRWSLGVSR